MEKALVQQLIQDFSIETTPRGFAKLAPLSQYLPEKTRVFVTFLPNAKFSDTIESAEKIAAQGFTPVVHIAARNLASQQELQEGLARLQEGGISDLLLLAGGANTTHSPYSNSLALLESGVLERFSWRSIGFAGHPEGQPDVTPEETWRSLQLKWQYAKEYPRDYYLATQFCFAAEPVITWRQALLASGIEFPVRLGVAGLASTAALIKHATLCGVGASINFLVKNMGSFRHLIGGVEAPSKFLCDLASALQQGTLGENVRLHFFPLGDFSRTTTWIAAVQAGKFHIDTEGVQVDE